MKIYNFLLINAFTTYIFLIILIITTHVSAQQDIYCNNGIDITNKAIPNARVVGFIRQQLTIDQIPWGTYTHIVADTTSLDATYINNLTSMSIIKGGSTKVVVSIGKTIFNNGPDQFIVAVQTYIANFSNINGIDLEYPTDCGNGNGLSPEDFATRISGLKSGLQGLSKDFTISVTIGPLDNTVPNLISESVDWVNVIGYRLNTGVYNPNPQGPTSPLVTDGKQQQPPFINFQGVAKSITEFDKKKIVMGIEFSGIIRQIYNSSMLKLENPNQRIEPLNYSTNPFTYTKNSPINDDCGKPIVNMNSVSWDDLKYSSDPLSLLMTSDHCKSNTGWIRKFDNVTKSTFLVSDNLENYYISYEDPQSLQHKVKFIQDLKLGGIMISNISANIFNNSNDLISVINYIKDGTGGHQDQPEIPSNTNEPSSSSSPSSGSSSIPSSTSSTTNQGSNDNPTPTGTLIGIIIGTIIGVAVIVSFVFVWYRYKSKQQTMITEKSVNNNNYQNVNSTSSFTAVPIPAPPAKGLPVTHVTALYDYEGKEDTDLSFKKGDVIEVIEKGEGPNDWWVGKIGNKAGEFPGNYVSE